MTPQQTLDSSYMFIMALLGEYEYVVLARNRAMYSDDEDDDEYIEMMDFETGKSKKIRKSNSEI